MHTYLKPFILISGSSSIFPSLGNTWSTGDVVTSTGSSLMFSFYSDSTGSLRGFQLQYLEVPRGINRLFVYRKGGNFDIHTWAWFG